MGDAIPDSGLSEAGKELLAGAAGGFAGVIAGQPLDTIRVRLQQSHCKYTKTRQIWKSMANVEGWRGLFKGMSYPLLTNSLQNAVTFHAYGSASRFLDALSGTGHQDAGVKYDKVFLAGMYAGAVQCPISTSVELLKIRMQLQKVMPNCNTYVGPLVLLSTVVRQEGLNGLMRGVTVTLLRDVPSYGVYFVCYTHLCQLFEDAFAISVGKERFYAAQAGVQFLSGGISGMLAWATIYPFDVVKSRMQAMSRRNAPGRTWLNYAIASYREGGTSVFFKGVVPTLNRAFLVNATIFAAYECCWKALHNGEEAYAQEIQA